MRFIPMLLSVLLMGCSATAPIKTVSTYVDAQQSFQVFKKDFVLDSVTDVEARATIARTITSVSLAFDTVSSTGDDRSIATHMSNAPMLFKQAIADIRDVQVLYAQYRASFPVEKIVQYDDINTKLTRLIGSLERGGINSRKVEDWILVTNTVTKVINVVKNR